MSWGDPFGYDAEDARARRRAEERREEERREEEEYLERQEYEKAMAREYEASMPQPCEWCSRVTGVMDYCSELENPDKLREMVKSCEAEAWDAGWHAGYVYRHQAMVKKGYVYGSYDRPTNPYRKESPDGG